jgi:competence protein ComEC
VGQGDAIFIRAPGGNQMLIDGGPPGEALEQELGKVMPFFDKTMDVVLATHPDQDHIGGFEPLFLHFPVSLYVEGGATSSSISFKNLEETLRTKNVQRIIARKNLHIYLGNGVVFLFYFLIDQWWDLKQIPLQLLARFAMVKSSFF